MNHRVLSISISTHCHATEDCGKVLEALRNILPGELRRSLVFNREDYTGHYGNRISIFTANVTGVGAELFLKYIGEKLSSVDKGILKASLGLRYDEKRRRLYLRFDKQAAYNGRIVLIDGDDVIKIVISFPRRVVDIRELLEGLGW